MLNFFVYNLIKEEILQIINKIKPQTSKDDL